MFAYLTQIPSLTFLRTHFLPPASPFSSPPRPWCHCFSSSLFCSLWISFSTPTSSFITCVCVHMCVCDFICSQIFHLYSVSPKSVSLALISQTPSLNLLLSKIVVISASQACVSKHPHLPFSQTISSSWHPKPELMALTFFWFSSLKPKSNLLPLVFNPSSGPMVSPFYSEFLTLLCISIIQKIIGNNIMNACVSTIYLRLKHSAYNWMLLPVRLCHSFLSLPCQR